jgi:hypothetical protein
VQIVALVLQLLTVVEEPQRWAAAEQALTGEKKVLTDRALSWFWSWVWVQRMEWASSWREASKWQVGY